MPPYTLSLSPPGRAYRPTPAVLCRCTDNSNPQQDFLSSPVTGTRHFFLLRDVRVCRCAFHSDSFFSPRLVRNMEKLHREFAFVPNFSLRYGYKCVFCSRKVCVCLTSVASISRSPITIKQAQINFICCLNIAFPVSHAFLSCAMGFYCIAYLMKSARCMHAEEQEKKKKPRRHVGLE